MDIYPTKSRIKFSQGSIFWRETGQEEPTVIFLHGSWDDSKQWLSVMKILGSQYHCLAIDLPGCGESDYGSNQQYSIALIISALAEYLSTLKVKNFYLVGHSLGAWVAASYACQYADQIKGLILLSPEGVKAGNIPWRWHKEKALVGKFPITFWLAKILSPFSKLIGQQAALWEILRKREYLLQSVATCHIFWQRRPVAIKTELLDEKLPWLKIPVLILQTSQQSAMVSRISQSFAELLPMVEVRNIEAQAGDLTEAAPEILAEYIRVFVDGLLFTDALLVKWD